MLPLMRPESFGTEDGFVFVVDRSKDLIIRGGYNVYPIEAADRRLFDADEHEASTA